MYSKSDIAAAKKLLDQARAIVILAPDSQDGDSISSNLALLRTFEGLGKTVYWLASEGRDKSYDFLPGNDRCLIPAMIDDKKTEVDLTVITDAGSLGMFERALEGRQWLIREKPVILIDHHRIRDDMGVTVEIIADLGATGELLYHVYSDMGWTITPEIAQLLMLGIYNDTQLFTNLNTNEAILRVAADLAALGAEPGLLAEQYQIVENPTPEGFTVLHRMLNGVRFDGPVAYCVVPYELVRAAPSGTSIRHYIGNRLRYVKGTVISFVLVEKDNNLLQLSLRCHHGYDVASIAQQFGGGGHTVAAGAIIKNYDSRDAVAARVVGLAKAEIAKHDQTV